MKNVSAKLIKNLTKSIDQISNINNKYELYVQIENVLEELTHSDFASLFIFNKKEQILYSEKNKKSIKLSMLEVEGCISKVFLEKIPLIYNHLASDKDYVPFYDNPFNHKLKSQMLIPIVEDEQLIGIARVSRGIHGNTNKYTKNDLEIFLSIESYLIKIIRTINSDVTLSNSSGVTEKIHKKIVEIKEKTDTTDTTNTTDKNLLLFLSNTVHDIRTPANSLYGFLELLEEEIKDKRLKEFVINAKESASFINTLTDSILEQTKNKYEGTISKPKIVNSVKFFSDITNIFTSKMIEKELDYFVFICPELPKEIKINTLKIKRILINLVGNAYKFTPRNKRINVFISYDISSQEMTISVKDEGIGIEEKDKDKLFKIFSQVSDNISVDYGGTGLGLSISSKYVSDLGGELQFKSNIDKGSEFYFTIPLDVINALPSYDKFHNLEKNIVILTDNIACINAHYIRTYIQKLGMPEEKIHISNSITNQTTHLICFEHKISEEILKLAHENKIKILFIEERLFSLLHNKQINQFTVVSENTYYGDAIHSTIYSGKKMKVLIVDDNKINVKLLSSMLSIEYVEIISCIDAEKSLKYLKDALSSGSPFDIIYLDKHMPVMSGTELIGLFRLYEHKYKVNPIFAVSISGDPDINADEKKLFNAFVNKPFNKKEVREVISLVKQRF